MKPAHIVAAVAVVASMPVAACDYCLISQGISPLQTQTGAGLRIAHRYTRLDSVYDGDDEVDNPGVREEYWTTELSGFVSLNERLTALVNLPLRKTKGDGELAEGPGGEPEREDITGDTTDFGDLSLLGRYRFLSRHTLDTSTLVAAVFGIKLPTGSTNRHGDQGEHLDSHLQPGTGSTDLLLGVSLDHAIGRYSLSANLLASLPGEGETGGESHRFGNTLNYDVTARYRVAPSVPGETADAFFVSLGVNGESRAKEELDGDTLDDTGGHTLYLTPGLQYRHGANWVVEATYQYAFYHKLNETQLGEDYRLTGSLTYLF